MGDVLDLEVVVGVVAITVSLIIWLVDRYVFGRKRIGWRVQMDDVLREPPDDAQDLPELKVLADGNEVENASFALVRVENDGSKPIVHADIQERLTVDFDGRAIVTAKVTAAEPPILANRLNGLSHSGSRVTLPTFGLNRGNHFKLFMLLSGNGSGGDVTMDGLLSGGKIVRNKQQRRPRKLYLSLGAFLLLVTGSLIGVRIIDSSGANSPECASGDLTLAGSTAFAPVTEQLASAYEERCSGARITVSATGSVQGLLTLKRAGQEADSDQAPDVLAVSDGRAGEGYQQFGEHPAGMAIFAVAVNDEARVHKLTSQQIRDIYAGEIRNWSEVQGADLPISLVSRDSGSGTRAAFERRVLDRREPGVTSDNCRDQDGRRDEPVRCERRSTTELLAEVAQVPGAMGYAELRAVAEHEGLHAVELDGAEADIDPIKTGDYPFWEVEYFYSYGQLNSGSVTQKFIDFLSGNTAESIMRSHGHIPCADEKSELDVLCRPR